MGLTDYRLLAQLSSGRDGVAYRAEPRTGGPVVELRRLSLKPDGAGTGRWADLTKRLALASRLTHPNLRRLLDVGLSSSPPFVTLEPVDGPRLADAPGISSPDAPDSRLRMFHSLASALVAAQRLGLILGRLDPWTVHGRDANSLKIDATGIDSFSSSHGPGPSGPALQAFVAPEAREGPDTEQSQEADIYSLGALGVWLLSGLPPDEGPSPDLRVPRSASVLIRSMLAGDPTARPTAVLVERVLSEIVNDLVRRGEFHNEPTTEMPPLPGTDASDTQAFTSEELNGPRANGAGPPVVPAVAVGGERSVDPGALTVAEPNPSKATLLIPEDSPSSSISATGVYGSPSDLETIAEPKPDPAPTPPPQILGRFRLVEKLGEGGMGEVYKAIDEADGSVVALKVLRPEWASKPTAMARFRKESRLLAKVNNPYVTNLIEVNEDRGLHYIVLEFVAGRSLDHFLKEKGRLDERTALAVAADVARGLMDAHRLGIVHRDIKPANILLVGTEISTSASAVLSEHPRVKLTDFGLARHAVESVSMAVTQSGVIVGTPTYMAPEQCGGGALDARADVYALGVTLFHLVAGRPPFEAEDLRAVIAKHMNEPAPPLRKYNSAASEGLSRVVAKALAKSPDARYADASAILEDLDRLLKGEPTALFDHPAMPAAARSDDAMQFDFSWELEAPARKLWPCVSNTDRLDRALGFGAVEYSMKFDPARGVRRFLAGKKAGMAEEGEEHPYEWVEGRRLGVYREFTKGPFHWVLSVVELTPRVGGGTTLTHSLRLVPRGWFMRLGTRWGVGSTLKRDLERVYRRIDAAITGKLGHSPTLDPFEPPSELPDIQQRRLDGLVARLVELGVEETVAQRLGEYVATTPAPELSRIRPIALARRLGLPDEQVIAACLHGANIGLFVLLWDLLCPVCRVPSEVKDTMKSLTDHGHCEACQLDYQLDFANSVELVFRSHPQVRAADTNLYCAAGPFHQPHVAAQVRLRPGERLDLDLELGEGDYKLRGPQLGWALDFRVRPGAVARRRDLKLSHGPEPGPVPELGARGQVLGLENDSGRELIVRVERTARRDDALTAARASSLALFRELFPTEVLAPGQLVSVERVALLLTALDRPRELYEALGDARAFGALHEMFRRFEAVIKREGGALVKTQGEGIFAVFGGPEAAVQTALALSADLDAGESTPVLRPLLRVAVHAGPVMAANLNDHLDYFGATVHKATLALLAAAPGALVLTEPVASDPRVAERLFALENVQGVFGVDALEAAVGSMLSLPLARCDETQAESFAKPVG
jgi:serine/threonine protein kinase/class 3 adenylate cyclase